MVDKPNHLFLADRTLRKNNQNSQMDARDLKNKIQDSVCSGKAPFCIVATAGTTITGSIDGLTEISSLAQENDMWLHVDAAYGGALIFSEKYKNKLAGIERAHSITFNPQKWLYVVKTCAMVLFRDNRILQNSFRITAPYMLQTENFTNIGEISVQGTHHADVLKLWLSLQHIGKRGYEMLIEESCKLTKYFVEQVSQRNYLQLSGEPETNIVCFRFAPRDSEQSQLDDLNLRLQKFLLRKGGAFLSLPVYKSGRWLRAVLLNAFTDGMYKKQV